jgi:hypothetical protein
MKKMKFVTSMALVAMAAAAFALTACNNNDDTSEGSQNVVVDGVLPYKINQHVALPKDTYTLNGQLIVEAGGVLEIAAGTKIEATYGFGSYILVLQGGKIKVMGTADEPVVMTADIADAKPGHWGGLIINGKAKISGSDNASPKTGSTEISSQYPYGGNNNADDSGEIHFLVLEYTGAKSTADVEHNGLTLNAVGSTTEINDLFVINGADDGIEFFGGAVDVTNLLVVNSDDDMFDFTMGYSGELKNAYGIWEAGYSTGEGDPRGIEADGNHDGLYPNDAPQSNFRVTNVTFDLRVPYMAKPSADDAGATANYQKVSMDDVVKVRRGATATIMNALVLGTTHVEDLVDLTDNVTLPGDNAPTPQNANTNTKIEIRSLLDPAADRALNPASGYSQVNVENSTNTGCDKSVFDWTGYEF